MEKDLATAAWAVTQRYVDYCAARAAGGVGVILLGRWGKLLERMAQTQRRLAAELGVEIER